MGFGCVLVAYGVIEVSGAGERFTVVEEAILVWGGGGGLRCVPPFDFCGCVVRPFFCLESRRVTTTVVELLCAVV